MDVNVTFDEDCNIRILEEEKFRKSQQLQEECKTFTTKIQDFTTTVQGILQVLEEQAERIEKAKLKAIGQRNNVESEIETRKAKEKQHIALVREREAELQRLETYYESLLKVENEQKAMIEKLSNNEA